jgi:hypothetical protein
MLLMHPAMSLMNAVVSTGLPARIGGKDFESTTHSASECVSEIAGPHIRGWASTSLHCSEASLHQQRAGALQAGL